MSLGYSADNVKPQTSSLKTRRKRSWNTIETLKNPLQLSFRNPNSVVSYAHGHVFIINSGRFYRHFYIASGILHSVIDQVRNRGSHVIQVALNLERRPGL